MTVFHTHFEMCSLAFLALLMYYFFRSRRVNNPSMHIYAYYMVLTYIVMLLDILSVIFLSSEIVNTLFLAMQVFMAPVFVLYVLSLANQTTRKNIPKLAIMLLPAALMFLTVLTNHWTNWIFSIDAAGRYYHGPLHSLMYVVAGAYLLSAFAVTLYWRQQLDRMKKNTIYIISLEMAVLMLLQLVLKNYLLVGTGVVLGQYMMYHTFQNPTDYTDASTGLFNRDALVMHLKRQRALKRRFCLGVVSLRSYRSINDVFGITTGDRLLHDVAVYLSYVCGASNTYRFVGDVFVLAFSCADEMRVRLGSIQRRFADTWLLDDLRIRISADLCQIDEERCNADADELVKLIEFSVKEAKLRRSAEPIQVDESVSEAMRRNVAIEQGLLNAIEENALEMHYQPLYAAKTGRFPTFEALARLHLEGVGYVPPDEFIRLAERSGLIVRLGEVILESVCRFLSAKHPEQYGIELAQINLSVVQCMDAGFAKRCAEILEKHHIDPRMICLEITESTASYSDATLLGNMAALRELGVGFALDDYGSGYSTADYVMRMPFSHVKLDKKLVSDAAVSERSRLLVCSLAELFGKLGFHVVAEGVETRTEADQLISCGVEYLQGYLYAKPMPEDAFMQFLAEKSKAAEG